jgi:uncharacterized membrane protein YeaQ/YmgE (transglycosylase-associated protein family)
MNLLLAILIGVAAGTMVELLLPGHRPGELFLAMALGVAGALVARYLGEIAGWYGTDEAAGFLACLIGAVGTLLLYGALFAKRHRKDGY